MSSRYRAAYFISLLLLGLSQLISPLPTWSQQGSEGTVAVTVLDPSGSIVAGAQLELTDTATGEKITGTTSSNGTYTFVNLNLGRYQLTISMSGFQKQVFDNVISQAARTTDVNATLKVGTQSETVEVNASATPVIEETSNAIGTTVDLKQIEDLPLFGRNLSQLSQLVPGFTGDSTGGGTWDGLPSIAQGNNIDGVIGSSSRMKFSGNASPAIEPRIEDIQEMTVQTEQLNLDQGFGQANMQVNFVTRRGTNGFHGRVYEDFRNTALDANSWLNDAATALDPSNPQKKNPLIRNEFGGSLGGPIIKNKLFFFGTFAMSKQPGSYTGTNYVMTSSAQAGNFTYVGTDNATHTVNLFQLAQNYNATNGGNLPTVLNSTGQYSPGAVLQSVNSAAKFGSLTPNAFGDPNLQSLLWQVPNPTTWYYPTVRVDYTPNEKMRFNVAWNMTKQTSPGQSQPDFPGSAWSKTGAGFLTKNYTAAFGFDYTISPNIVNEFRGGFLYDTTINSNGAQPLSLDAPQLGWNYTNVPGPYNTQMSGTVDYTSIGDYYPVFNASDTVTWQHGAHTMNFGFSWWRELDHYYNGVLGFPGVNFGLATGDSAQNAFPLSALPAASSTNQAEAWQLYAILAGRVSGVSGSYTYQPSQNNYCTCLGAYNLDELAKSWGLFFQDSYRIKRNFTLNYGLRWDFNNADRDATNLYHSATTASIWGPSGIGNLFHPGVLNDPTMVPELTQISQPYNNWNISPQPAIGFAWNPRGDGKTVIRGGYSLRKFTEPQQYVWNQASDYGSFYYQSFFLNANTTGAQGTFTPGSLSISNFDPATWRGLYGTNPKTFLKTEPVSDFTFAGGPGLFGIQYNIQQPYTQSWNLGIQRQLGESRALEVRYIGSLTQRQWIPIPTDEVNIFENGFLKQFKAAQQNLNINKVHGITSFANNGYAGQQATPLFDAAFAGETSGGTGIPLSDYGAGNFITDLTTGQAGAMANTLAGINGTVPYFCNLVGSSFGPCANNIGFTGAGAGYPINFFQTNPYAQGTGFGYPNVTEAEAYSNYNAMQVDFRQRAWHGLQFDANYTWSHTLGIGSQNNWQGEGALFTNRNMRLSYGPALFDLRNVVHVSGNYDLPFGRGKQFLNTNGVLDRVVGGWTIGTILTFQSGYPFLLGSGLNTLNDFADSGVVLNGVTASQLQSAVGTYRIPGTTEVSLINPKYLASPTGGGANPQFILPNTTPGTIGQRVWLHGPHNTFDDMAITKAFPITERVRFSLQAEMLNAFNHPVFSSGTANGCTYGCFSNQFSPYVQNGSFGIVNGAYNPNNSNPTTGGARLIELRANVEF